MLAGTGLPTTTLDDWAVEPKLDGWRALVSVEGGARGFGRGAGATSPSSVMEPLSWATIERLRRSAAMGGLPRDACEQLLGEVARLRAQLVAVDGDLQKVEAILHCARARLRA